MYHSKIKAIGICSDAHFGLSSYDNIGKYSMFNRFWGKDGVVIPYNIVIPKYNVSVFIIHGTGDTVIPFGGGKYTNIHAKDRSHKTLWRTFDPSENNTYTPNIETYTYKIKQANSCFNTKQSGDDTYVFHTHTNGTVVVNLAAIDRQNHCWSGHTSSGPGSSSSSNFHLDATYLFLLFFNLPLGRYRPTVHTIPEHMTTYDNQVIQIE